MTQTVHPDRARSFYWMRYTDGHGSWRREAGRPPGEDLAALRRGIGREAGSVPQLWPFYTTLTADGRSTRALLAEHVALTLYAVHQQSQEHCMHRDGVGLGAAVSALRRSGKFSPEAVDRRFAAAATATSIVEVSAHLRGLVHQLKTVGQPLDYTLLARDLRDWQTPQRIGAVRRRWGGQYFTPHADDPEPAAGTAAARAGHSEGAAAASA
jgi:CRISPR system Cascade subunit CasB